VTYDTEETVLMQVWNWTEKPTCSYVRM